MELTLQVTAVSEAGTFSLDQVPQCHSHGGLDGTPDFYLRDAIVTSSLSCDNPVCPTHCQMFPSPVLRSSALEGAKTGL